MKRLKDVQLAELTSQIDNLKQISKVIGNTFDKAFGPKGTSKRV